MPFLPQVTFPEPDESLKVVIYLLVGEKWPQGDEQKMLVLADAWDKLAVDLEGVDAEIVAATGVFKGSGLGDAFDAAGDYLDQFVKGSGGEEAVLPKLRAAARDLAEMCRKVAM